VQGVIAEEVLTDEHEHQKNVIGLLSLVIVVNLVKGLQDPSPVRGQGLQSAVTGQELPVCHGITASQGRHLWIKEVSGLCLVIVTDAIRKIGFVPPRLLIGTQETISDLAVQVVIDIETLLIGQATKKAQFPILGDQFVLQGHVKDLRVNMTKRLFIPQALGGQSHHDHHLDEEHYHLLLGLGETVLGQLGLLAPLGDLGPPGRDPLVPESALAWHLSVLRFQV